MRTRNTFLLGSYQDDGPESSIVSIGQTVNKSVHRVSALDVIVEACGFIVSFFFSIHGIKTTYEQHQQIAGRTEW